VKQGNAIIVDNPIDIYHIRSQEITVDARKTTAAS